MDVLYGLSVYGCMGVWVYACTYGCVGVLVFRSIIIGHPYHHYFSQCLICRVCVTHLSGWAYGDSLVVGHSLSEAEYV